MESKAKICDSWSTTTAYTQGDESGLTLLIGLSTSDPSLSDIVWNSDQTAVFTKHIIRTGYWTENERVGAMSLFFVAKIN